MKVETIEELRIKKCTACEGGVAPISDQQAAQQVAQLDGWRISDEGAAIVKKWTAKNFMSAIDFFNRVARLAEDEGHHPDLHLEGYRNVRIELTTHAIGGLSENDFILAAKIDELPIELRR